MDVTLVSTIVGYFLLMLGIAWYSTRKGSIARYFLNERKTGFWLMLFSSFATIVGAGAVIAVITESHRTGISYGIAMLASFFFGTIILALVAKRIREVGDRYDAYTIVDVFGARFDARNRRLMLVMQLVTLLCWNAVQVIGIATLAAAVTGVSFTTGLLIAAAITVAYTAVGGLRADILTDAVQSAIMLVVFAAMTVIGLSRTGGITGLLNHLPAGHLDPFAFGGVSWTVGIILVSGFVYLTNTAHWQRILSARNADVARNSFFGLLPILCLFSLAILCIGLLSVALLPDADSALVSFTLIGELLPPWVAGLGIAAFLAVMMSSIDSLVIGGSTTIYREFLAKGRHAHGLLAARLTTLLFGAGSFAIAFLFPDIIDLSMMLGGLILIPVPAILAALYSERISSDASFWSVAIPAALFLVLYPFLEKNTFLVTVPLSATILLLYDRNHR